MRIQKFRKFQDGGAMPAGAEQMPAEGAPMEGGAPAGGQDQMIQQIAQMAQQIIQQMGPEAAAMLAQIIMEMLQGGGAGAPQGPVEARPEGEPVYRKGGKICGYLRTR